MPVKKKRCGLCLSAPLKMVSIFINYTEGGVSSVPATSHKGGVAYMLVYPVKEVWPLCLLVTLKKA